MKFLFAVPARHNNTYALCKYVPVRARLSWGGGGGLPFDFDEDSAAPGGPPPLSSTQDKLPLSSIAPSFAQSSKAEEEDDDDDEEREVLTRVAAAK